MDQVRETLQHLHQDFKEAFDRFLAPSEHPDVTWDQVVKARDRAAHHVMQHPELKQQATPQEE